MRIIVFFLVLPVLTDFVSGQEFGLVTPDQKLFTNYKNSGE